MKAQLTHEGIIKFIQRIKKEKNYEQKINPFIQQYSINDTQIHEKVIDSLMLICYSQEYGNLFQSIAFHLLQKSVTQFYLYLSRADQEQNPKEILILQFALTSIKKYYNKRDIIKHLQIILSLTFNRLNTEWIHIQSILDDLKSKNSTKIIPAFHTILTILSTFQYNKTHQLGNLFFCSSTATLNILINIINSNPSEQLIYLGIKCLWKIIRHSINIHIAKLSNKWMPLLKKTIESYKPQYHYDISKSDIKGSSEFYYFHTKKWSLRIILRFFQKHALKLSTRFENNHFSEQWFLLYGNNFVASLISLFNMQLPAKNRYFHLRCIQQLASDRSQTLMPYKQKLNYELLPKFIVQAQQQYQLMTKNPYEFHKEYQIPIDNKNFSNAAIQAWTAIACMGSRNHPIFILGDILFENMNYIFHLLDSTLVKDQQMAYQLLQSIFIKFNGNIIITRFSSIVLDKYFFISFSFNSILLKKLVLNYFISSKENNIVDPDKIQLIIIQMLRTIEIIQVPQIQLKCFAFICILGSKRKYLSVIQQNMQSIINIFQNLINVCPCEMLFKQFDQLTNAQYKQFSQYACKISSKLIFYLTTIKRKGQDEQVEQFYFVITSILNLIQKNSLLLSKYEDFLLFSSNLTKLLAIYQERNKVLIIVKNYIQKSYTFCKKNQLTYLNLWEDIIIYLQNLHDQLITVQREQSVLQQQYEKKKRIKRIYLQINIYFVEIMQSQIPIRLLENVFKFFSILSIQRIQQGINISFVQLYGLILHYNQAIFMQKYYAWIIIEAILKSLNNYTSIIKQKSTNNHILIIDSLLRLQNKPHNLIYLFEQIFYKLLRIVHSKSNKISKKWDKFQDSESNSGDFEWIEQEQSQSQEDQEIIEQNTADLKALHDYYKTIKYIDEKDNNLYQKLITRVRNIRFYRIHKKVFEIVKDLE